MLYYNGFLFKFGPSFDRELHYYPEEVKAQIRWSVIKQWIDMLKYARNPACVHEFNKLPMATRDELLQRAMTQVLFGRPSDTGFIDGPGS